MKLVVYGGSGLIGSRIVAAAVARGHEVTAVTRSGTQVSGAIALAQDLTDTDAVLSTTLFAHAAVVAISVGDSAEDREALIAAHRRLLAAQPVARFIIVGGAGSLMVGEEYMKDTDAFEPEWRESAQVNVDILNLYRASYGTDYTVVCPSHSITSGARQGYVLGSDSPVGQHVSTDDFADAVVDEIENPTHRWQRITVASRDL